MADELKAITVEVAKMELAKGDILVLTPSAAFPEESRRHLHDVADAIGEQTGAMCIVGSPNVTITIIKQVP